MHDARGARETHRRSEMTAFRNPTFSDRLKTAASARDAHLARFRARPAADDPAVLQQRAARQAVASARELRAAERIESRRAEELRCESEQAARATEAKAEREARQLHEAVEQAALQEQRKAARDARYAARKSRKA
jgi:hypothetical protein